VLGMMLLLRRVKFCIPAIIHSVVHPSSAQTFVSQEHSCGKISKREREDLW